MKRNQKVDTHPRGKSKPKKSKIYKKKTLVFKEDDRKEFLTGFRKRKLLRQKKAQKELQELLAKKRIEERAKNRNNKILALQQTTELEDSTREDYELSNKKISVVKLNAMDTKAATSDNVKTKSTEIKSSIVKNKRKKKIKS